MGQSVYEIIEGNNNEAYGKLRETALQPEIVVDAPSLGQPGDAIKSHSRRRKAGIDVDGTDDLILYVSQGKPPSSPLQSPSAPFKTVPSMAPGVGGFNIDAPVQRASPARRDVAVVDMPPRALPGPNLVPQAPLQAQRMAEIVESGEPSFVLRLLAIIAIAGVLLLVFRNEIRNQFSDRLQTITSLCKGL
jgi:hypothetical protein